MLTCPRISNFKTLIAVVLFTGLCFKSHAQTPKVSFPKKQTATDPKDDSEQGKGSEFRMSARRPANDAKANTTENAFPPGTVNLGVLDESIGASLPANLKPLAKEGAMAMVGRDFTKAKAVYEKMVAALPNNEFARANLGMAEYRLKDYPAAREQFNSAVRINPKIAQNWLNLGLVHFREGSLEMAISSLTRSIALEPENAKAHLYLGVVVGQYGWADAAEKELQRSIHLDATVADAHFNLALLYLRKTPVTVELARRHYYTAIDLGAKPDPAMENEIKAAALEASKSTK